jgi:L-lactate dehydrogenase complex protein LldG
MLANIRNALKGGGPPGPQADPAIGFFQESDTAQFAESLTTLGGHVLEAETISHARALIDQLLAGRSYIASPAPILQSAGLATPFSRDACASAEFGVTSADFALADTGSLVFLSESHESRLISLLPPRHIAVIAHDQILPTIDALFARVPHPAANSSSMVIVTGPSRTADIEMRLVRGVHGPGEIFVIIVKDVTRV